MTLPWNSGGFPSGSVVMNCLQCRGIQVRSLDKEDYLEEGMATCTSCLENPHPGESPWTEEPGRLQSIELHRVGLKRVSMQARTWHCDLIGMLPRHLDFKSSPGDPNV